MPRISPNNPFVSGQVTPETPLVRPEVRPAPSLLDATGAAFRVENSLGSWLNDTEHTGLVQEGYDALDDIEGYENFADSFVDSYHPQDTTRIKAQIDREMQDRDVLAQSGAAGFVAQLAAGVTDPIYLPLMLIPGTQLVKGGASVQTAGKFAALAAGAEAAAEAAKHGTQEVRSIEESLVNVGASAVLSSVLGTALSKTITPIEKQALIKKINEDFVEMDRRGSVGAARTDQELSFDDLALESAGGLEKLPVSPAVRMGNAPIRKLRELAHSMIENPLVTKGAKEGKSPVPVGGSLETKIKKYDAGLAKALSHLDDQYSAYRKRTKGQQDRLTKRQFYSEVGRAGRRNDEHLIPEVSSAAKFSRANVYDPLKDRAIKVGLFDEDIAVKTAPSYQRRMYNSGKIIQQREEWNTIVERWVSQQASLSAPEVKGVANQITSNILGHSAARIPYDIPISIRGPLKERVFDIPDELIEDFLEDDIELLLRNYNRTMAPDVEMVDMFGDVNMTDVFEEIDQEFLQLQSGKSAKEKKALDQQQKSLKDDVEMLRDILTNRYLGSSNPNHWAARASRSLRDVNYLSKLGGMTLSAIPDLGSIVITNGIAKSFGGLFKLITAPQQFRMSMKSAREMGVGLDMVLNSRASAIADIDDVFARNTKFERGLKKASNQFGKVALMSQWNSGLKQFSAVVTQSRLLEGAQKMADGTASNAMRQRLATSGISDDMAKRIADQYAKYGEPGDVNLPRVDLWDDLDAVESFESAILKDVDRAIITPGAGERPTWMNNETGKVIGQFKTFAISAHHKILLSNLQYRDAQALNGMLMMLAFGAAAYASKQYVAGRDISSDPKKLFVESLDRSGLLGFFGDVNNTVEKVSRGNVGLNAMIGESPMSRYASRNWLGSALGPSFGSVQDIGEGVGDIVSGEADEGTIRAARKLLPGQNIFYIRKLLDGIEEEIQ